MKKLVFALGFVLSTIASSAQDKVNDYLIVRSILGDVFVYGTTVRESQITRVTNKDIREETFASTLIVLDLVQKFESEGWEVIKVLDANVWVLRKPKQ